MYGDHMVIISEKQDAGLKQMQEMVKGSWMDLGSSWKVSDSKRSPYKASWWAQMRAVLWRSCLANMKEPVLIKVRVLQTVMVGLLIGVIYYGQELNQNGVMNINGAIFVLITNMTFQNVFAVINVRHKTNIIACAPHAIPLVAKVSSLLQSRARCPVYHMHSRWPPVAGSAASRQVRGDP
uniref:ABC-2 type transporter transmembrane domain-containing protein n=1 Tax=Timema monikensis TaxID=170555 RepID=A0A7R9EEY8_9NEOP|nr:unnamed protein product [Timema monikensis]